jgi:hypothetical protein
MIKVGVNRENLEIPQINPPRQYTVGVEANNLVQLTEAGKLPAVDGSLITNLLSN